MSKFRNFVKSFFLLFKRKKIIPILQPESKELLCGKTVVVIGGCGGIGLAIVKKMVKNGAYVIVTGQNQVKLDKVKKEFQEKIETVLFSLTDFSSYDDIIEKCSSFTGRVDVLVNSAGIHKMYKGFNYFSASEEEYDEILEVNLKANFFLCQKFGKYFMNNKIKGHILIISSQSALEPAWSPYRLSKNGLDSVIRGAAQQLIKYGIVVNGLGPGPTNTSMQNYESCGTIYTEQNPIYRYTTIDEVAEFAVMLSSNLGDTIVGQTLYMSGGRGITEIR